MQVRIHGQSLKDYIKYPHAFPFPKAAIIVCHLKSGEEEGFTCYVYYFSCCVLRFFLCFIFAKGLDSAAVAICSLERWV